MGIQLYKLWCVRPLSTIFQLYRGSQFYWWRKPDSPEKPTDHSQTLLYRVDLVWMELELNIIVVLDTHYI